MVDEEVETVLREIKERVTLQPTAEPPSSSGAASIAGNGAVKSHALANAEAGVRSSEATICAERGLGAELSLGVEAWRRLAIRRAVLLIDSRAALTSSQASAALVR